MNAVALGPLVFDAARFAAMLGIAAFFLTAELADRKAQCWGGDVDVSGKAVLLFLVWIVAARLGWVATNWPAYARQPLDILRFWQGGFQLGWGFAAAMLAAGWIVLRQRALSLPLALVCSVAVATGALAAAALVGQDSARLPEHSLTGLAGRPVSLAAPPGPLVVNLWASWCPPCRRELPMMMELAEAPGAPRFVLANQGETLAQVRDFLAATGLPSGDIALDPGYRLMGAFDAVGLPLTLFFDAEGQMVAAQTGEISRAELLRRFAELSGETD